MSDQFSKEGDQNLKILAGANNFTLWMYEQIKPYLKGHILEIGSGRGNYSKLIIRDFPHNQITLSEIDENYIANLKTQFSTEKIKTIKLNLEKTTDFEMLQPIDSAFALNVLEHVEHDEEALNNLYKKLTPGGTLAILVPAHQFLYNCIDKSVGHYRRYDKKQMISLVAKTPFKIKTQFYFNAISILGWYWGGNILKKDILSENKMQLLDKLVPFLRFIEKYILRKKVGMSLVTILEK